MKFDSVLITGNKKELYDYSSDIDVCIVVDWRGEEDSILNDFGKKLAGDNLFAEYSDTGLLVNYNGVLHTVPLTFSMKDRYLAIRSIAKILSDKYEIRVFENSLGSDTHVFYVKPKIWWQYMDDNFPERMKQIFVEIEDNLDFGSRRDASHAIGNKS